MEGRSLVLCLLGVLGLGLGLVGGGCASAPARTSTAPPPPPPGWGFQALTWEKLGEVEAWLDGPGPAHYPERRVEAELVLAEGRLTFAQQDLGRIPSRTLARRISSAEVGFRRVVASSDASSPEVTRARRGLEDAKALRERVSAPVEAAGPALVIQDRATWGARPAVPARMTSQRRGYSRITVHHSAPPNHLASFAPPAVYHDEIQRIQRYHMDQSSPRCGDIGYHFLIDPSGRVYQGRALNYQGAHSGGVNNRDNIGICLLGDFRDRMPEPAALEALETLLQELSKRHGIPLDAAHLLGHGELKATECPGRHLQNWVRRLRG